MALMGQFGQPKDVAAYSIMSIESGPFLTMVTLGAAGLSAFPWQTLVGAILPLLVGIALGNLDGELRTLFGRAVPALIPFFAFALGAGINLANVWRAGLLGVLVGVGVLVTSGVGPHDCRPAHRRQRRRRVAAASTAANAAAVPAIVATREPRVCRSGEVRDRARRGQRGRDRHVDAARHGLVGGAIAGCSAGSPELVNARVSVLETLT